MKKVNYLEPNKLYKAIAQKHMINSYFPFFTKYYILSNFTGVNQLRYQKVFLTEINYCICVKKISIDKSTDMYGIIINGVYCFEEANGLMDLLSFYET